MDCCKKHKHAREPELSEDIAVERKLHGEHARSATIWGAIAGLGLLTLYFTLLTVLNSWQHAVDLFIDLSVWMVLLVVLFGTQVGLYRYVKLRAAAKEAEGATGTVAASGGVSTGSMVACCLHHVTEVLPLLGISAAAIFFSKYQAAFMVLGIVSSVIGTVYMLKLIQEHELYIVDSFLAKLMRTSMQRVLYASIIAGTVAITTSVLIV